MPLLIARNLRWERENPKWLPHPKAHTSSTVGSTSQVKKKDLPIMIKVDIYLKVHNDNIHTYVIKQNYVIVHAYHNVIYIFFADTRSTLTGLSSEHSLHHHTRYAIP